MPDDKHDNEEIILGIVIHHLPIISWFGKRQEQQQQVGWLLEKPKDGLKVLSKEYLNSSLL